MPPVPPLVPVGISTVIPCSHLSPSPCPSPLRCLESLNVWQSATTLHGPASQQAVLSKGISETKETIESHGGMLEESTSRMFKNWNSRWPETGSKTHYARLMVRLLFWGQNDTLQIRQSQSNFSSNASVFTIWYPFLRVLIVTAAC